MAVAAITGRHKRSRWLRSCLLPVYGAAVCALLFVSCINNPSAPPAGKRRLVIDTLYTGVSWTIDSLGSHELSRVDSLYIAQGSTHIRVTDTGLVWTPVHADIGIDTIEVVVFENGGSYKYTMIATVRANAPESCPLYTKKHSTVHHSYAGASDGFFIFMVENRTGLWVSPLRRYAPRLIPQTETHEVYTPDIHESGEYICYVDLISRKLWLISPDGSRSVMLPTQGNNTYYPTACGFYKNSPRGNEVFYLATDHQIRAAGFEPAQDSFRITHDRLIADVSPQYKINGDVMGLDVAGDQILASINPARDDIHYHQTGYITIPGDGEGTAGPDDVYQWSNPVNESVYGCGHTLSPDGTHALYNPGEIFDTTCIPAKGHNGFVVTPFRHTSHAPVDFYTEHIQEYGTSINFCPAQYITSTRAEADFWGWNFTNHPSYVAGRQTGSIPECGAWLVNWHTNTWHRLTPKEENVKAYFVACHFGGIKEESLPAVDTTRERDTLSTQGPYYEIREPNGGETYSVGDTLTVRCYTSDTARVNFELLLQGGLYSTPIPPGVKGSYTIYQQQMEFSFVIPDSFSVESGASVSAVSSCCYIRVSDYTNPGVLFDVSDSCFTVGE